MSTPAEAASTEDLLGAVIAEATRPEEDDEAYWQLVYLLHKREVQHVWTLIEPLVDHKDPRVRAIVPDVLRALGGRPQPLAGETVALFRRLLREETAPVVLTSIGYALGEIRLPVSVELMAPFAHHPNANVRHAVVAALLTQGEVLAIETLIELSRDPDDHVRDWATFGLGSQLGDPEFPDSNMVDTPALREALAARLEDPHDDTRCEAIVGLAMRRDPRVLPVLQKEIEDGAQFSLVLEAARYMAAPELCAGLRRLAASDDKGDVDFWNKNGLPEAIAACCGGEGETRPESD